MLQSNKQEIKQGWQEACMDEQEAPDNLNIKWKNTRV